ncbi:MAG: hypothetical protein ACFB22_02255 [Rhodothalassiaceae bacterium]
MNQFAHAFADPIPAPAFLDLKRAEPRRVVGFSTLVETSLSIDELRTSLEMIAGASAFRLDALSLEDDGMRAEFALTARCGSTGDTQIFALLREIAARHRWNGMEKRLAR